MVSGLFADMDKVPMEAVIKRAALTEKDWWYLENRIRVHIHELMMPYLTKAEQSREAVREMREQMNSNRNTIEDLAMG